MQLTKVDIYRFIERLEKLPSYTQGNLPFSFVYGDEFRKLRQIVNFYYTHGGN